MKKGRLGFLQIIFLVLLASLLGRLYYWQIIHHDRFVLAASEQHLTTIRIEAPRGRILANDGSLLVANQKAFLLYAYLPEIKKELKNGQLYHDRANEITELILPILFEAEVRDSKDPEKLSRKEKETLEANLKQKLVRQLNQDGVVWVPLAHKISPSDKEAIDVLKIKGLGFQEQSKRFYPENALASTILGFVGKDKEGNDHGYSGLEGFYEDQLRGRGGKLTQEVDAAGRPILTGEVQEAIVRNGLDIETTIDRSVQYTVERYLFDGAKKYGAKSASAIVLDAKTGAVLAMANSPGFDPNKWSEFGELERRNSAISDIYEPGSTFKIITAAAALDSGKVKTDTICPCTGPIKVSGYEVQTASNKYYPNSNMAEILQYSDNIGAAFWSQQIGRDTFLNYLDKFGFGKATGIDLQGEETGLLKPKKEWREIEMVTGAFGQGLSVTPLQIASFVQAVANDGRMMKPFLAKKIVSDNKKIDQEPKFLRQVIKPEVATIMKELLLSAVENGEARKSVPKGMRIGGKTGTAQIPKNGKYDPGKTVASFVGFGPIEDPKFVMIIKFVEPTPIWGSETAQPTFFRIATELYNYWGIPIR